MFKNDSEEKVIETKNKTFNFTTPLNYEIIEKIKLISNNTVIVIGINSDLNDIELLKTDQYFGQYGNIKKIVLLKSKNFFNKKHKSLSCFITYENALEATSAILSLDDKEHMERVLKASYGTSKLCKFFYFNNYCKKENCNYSHENFTKENSIFKDEEFSNKNLMEFLKETAINYFNKNKDKIVIKKVDKTVFPGLNDLIKSIKKISLEFFSEKEIKIDNEKNFDNININDNKCFFENNLEEIKEEDNEKKLNHSKSELSDIDCYKIFGQNKIDEDMDSHVLSSRDITNDEFEDDYISDMGTLKDYGTMTNISIPKNSIKKLGSQKINN